MANWQLRQTTGIKGLDDILGGGLPSNRLYVIAGAPGSGKTTMALQFLLEGARNGERVLYVTLSETTEELNDVARSHGWELAGIDLLELNSLSGRLEPESEYTVYHPADVELGDTIRSIQAEVQRLSPTRVALDSASELKILSQTSVRFRREILGLKQFFAGRKCTVLVLDDLTSRDSDQPLESIAHGVVCMEREGREYGTTKRQLHILKMRGLSFLDGRHDFVIRRGGLEIFPRLSVNTGQHGFDEGEASSGIEEMDALFGGGLDRGSSTLLVGPAGCGKTTMCSHYLMAALRRGEPAAFFMFEESQETFLRRGAGFGMDFQSYIDNGKFELVRLDIANLSPGEFASRVQAAVEERHARFVAIDSLNGYLNGMPSERYLLIHMHELLSYLGHQGVVTLMAVAQHGMMGTSMHSPIDVSFLADSVILLRFFEASGSVRQAISVVKKRRGAHERTLREMRFSRHGMQIGEVLQEFQGVLTGVPHFVGQEDKLLEPKKKLT